MIKNKHTNKKKQGITSDIKVKDSLFEEVVLKHLPERWKSAIPLEIWKKSVSGKGRACARTLKWE